MRLREMSAVLKPSILVCLAFIAAMTGFSVAQDGGHGVAARKVTYRVTPATPELARKMHIQGTVKLEVVVKPNGSVKESRVTGGNPVLAQAAADAINKWKFEAGPSETTELIQLSFVPQ